MKRLDDRINHLVLTGVHDRHRSLVVLIGDKAQHQVPNLHAILQKASGAASSVLWCYSTKPQFSSHREKRNKQLRYARLKGQIDTDEASVFDSFFTTNTVRYVHYRDTETILGTTFSMLVLQDFASLTPNILGQTIECVAGGGLVVLLLNTFSSLQQLHTTVMDFHGKFSNIRAKVEASKYAIVNRFNARFIALLALLRRCLALDQDLTVLPLTDNMANLMSVLSFERSLTGLSKDQQALEAFKQEVRAAAPAAKVSLVQLAATIDQARLVAQVYDLIDTSTAGALSAQSRINGRSAAEFAADQKSRFSSAECDRNMELSQSVSGPEPELKPGAGAGSDAASEPPSREPSSGGNGPDSSVSPTPPGPEYLPTPKPTPGPKREKLSKDELLENHKLNLLRKHNKAQYLKVMAERERQAASAAAPSAAYPVCALIAGRGRGKSASLGILLAVMVAKQFSHVVVSAPNPSNVQTLFEFALRGLQALGYREFVDYTTRRLGGKDADPLVQIAFHRGHKQNITYVSPDYLTTAETLNDADGLQAAGAGGPSGAGSLNPIVAYADALVLDECASIPLLTVKRVLDNIDPSVLCIVSSTCQGYEASGRSLSLKLLNSVEKNGAAKGQTLCRLALDTPIRYAPADDVERWLNQLLCLDADNGLLSPGSAAGSARAAAYLNALPLAEDCQLYRVSKDALFSGLKAAEGFLQGLWAIFTASHYKNSPNDLILLSDNPLHEVYVLLAPVKDASALPTVLCACQLAYEGSLRTEIVRDALDNSMRYDGDMLSWLLCQQFQRNDFAELAGARVVRIATNPQYAQYGYGSRLLRLLASFFRGDLLSASVVQRLGYQADDRCENFADDGASQAAYRVPPLLQKLHNVRPARLQYLGVGFGLTEPLLRFWLKAGYKPVYLRQSRNEVTGEHTCVMVRPVSDADRATADVFEQFCYDFRRRFLRSLRYDFSHLHVNVAFRLAWPRSELSVERPEDPRAADANRAFVDTLFTRTDLERLRGYSRHRLDLHTVLDLVPPLAECVYSGRLYPVSLSHVQARILLCIGSMNLGIPNLSRQLGLSIESGFSQANALFKKCVAGLLGAIEAMLEGADGAGTSASAAEPGVKQG